MMNVPMDLDQPCGEHLVYRDLRKERGPSGRRVPRVVRAALFLGGP